MLDDPGFPLTSIYENCQIFFSFYTRPDLSITNKPQVPGKEKRYLLYLHIKKGWRFQKVRVLATSKFPSLGKEGLLVGELNEQIRWLSLCFRQDLMGKRDSYPIIDFSVSFFLRNSIEPQLPYYPSLTLLLIPSWQDLIRGKLFVDFNNFVSCPLGLTLTTRKSFFLITRKTMAQRNKK